VALRQRVSLCTSRSTWPRCPRTTVLTWDLARPSLEGSALADGLSRMNATRPVESDLILGRMRPRRNEERSRHSRRSRGTSVSLASSDCAVLRRLRHDRAVSGRHPCRSRDADCASLELPPPRGVDPLPRRAACVLSSPRGSPLSQTTQRVAHSSRAVLRPRPPRQEDLLAKASSRR